MFVFNQVIDEKDEILYEFFERNLKQLQYYKDAFDDIGYKDEILIVEAIKKHIQEEYIPNYKIQYYKYNFLKKDINVNQLSKCLNILKKTDNEDFKIFLLKFIEYFNFFLYEDYLNKTFCSKF
ncbi:11489_t:CDS:1 [Scutellospora calospora]|uniref:11489_t:CDS:1 n=1 Tax=Scutellospora calospora TaxID=85575 RepID=A0ACA9LZZ2_9GLOM|nr:11489_t:CDS:1 [Scutellospora calospora]